jgi:predicted Holliday junction resolvase-like endonuclease
VDISVVLGVGLGLAIGVMVWFVFAARERALRAEFATWHEGRVKDERKDALTSSRRVLVGKYLERFVPFSSGYEPADMHFLGSPVDYVVFKGLHEDACSEVVFLEVKTNDAALTKRERSVRDAIRAGKVKWEEVRVDAIPTTTQTFAS